MMGNIDEKTNLMLAIYGVVALSIGFMCGYYKDFILILIELILIILFWFYFEVKNGKPGT